MPGDASNNLSFHSQVGFFSTNANEPIMVISAEKNDAKRAPGDVNAFVNMLTKKILKVVDIKLPPVDYDHGQNIEQFSNEDIYIIYDKLKIFKVNKDAYSVEDVTASLFSHQPLMSSGIATVAFIYRRDGEGFTITNNEGKDLYYYPQTDSIYNQAEEYKATSRVEQKRSTDKLTTGFSFSDKINNSINNNKLLQLRKYDEKISNGGSNGNSSRNIVDFTPGRTYFNPKVLCFDADQILILFSISPAVNAAITLQCLDAKTGVIKWTTPLETKYI